MNTTNEDQQQAGARCALPAQADRGCVERPATVDQLRTARHLCQCDEVRVEDSALVRTDCESGDTWVQAWVRLDVGSDAAS